MAKKVPARVSVIAADGRAYAPDNAWMHADDGFDRSLQPFENHYFHCPGECTVIVRLATRSCRSLMASTMPSRNGESASRKTAIDDNRAQAAAVTGAIWPLR